MNIIFLEYGALANDNYLYFIGRYCIESLSLKIRIVLIGLFGALQRQITNASQACVLYGVGITIIYLQFIFVSLNGRQ